jgi:hypothetical protein
LETLSTIARIKKGKPMETVKIFVEVKDGKVVNINSNIPGEAEVLYDINPNEVTSSELADLKDKIVESPYIIYS